MFCIIRLQRYAAALAASSSRPPHSMGAFSYSSGLSDHGEGSALAACLPGMPTQVRSVPWHDRGVCDTYKCALNRP